MYNKLDTDSGKIRKLESRLKRIEDISQLPATATLDQVIKAINKITDSVKRRRNDS